MVGEGAVSVLFAGWRVHGVAGPHDDDLVSGGDDADAFGDVEGLAEAVAVPCGAGAGGEADRVDAHPGVPLAAGYDVEPHVGVGLAIGLAALSLMLLAPPERPGTVFVAAIAGYTLARQILFRFRVEPGRPSDASSQSRPAA